MAEKCVLSVENKETTRILLTLALTEGIGPGIVHNIIECVGSISAIAEAKPRDFLEVPRVSRATAERIAANLRSDIADKEFERTARIGVDVIPIDSSRYPLNLSRIPDAPIVLFVKGDLLRRDTISLAIVGARRCTHYGRMQAQRFSMRLASAGFTIVSGLARGIDTAAHDSAVRAGGRTIAVLAYGHARVPKHNAELIDRIAASGAVVSELSSQTPASRKTFPPRNRLISGLSLGVFVVEGLRGNGSLITANWAAEHGRDVFALPGQVDNPQSRGPHRLIKEGAKLVETPQDIVDELGPLSEVIQIEDDREEIDDPRLLSLNETEQAVFRALDVTPRSIEDIIEGTRLAAGACSSTLLILEMRGLAKRLPGNQFVRS